MERRQSIVFGVGLLAGALLAGFVGYEIGRTLSEDDRLAFANIAERVVIDRSNAAYRDVPIVQDAIRRWTAKNGGDAQKAMSGYQIQFITTPQQRCIKFDLAGGYDVGGEPTFCYKPFADRLTYEDTDVE
jgi:uncharacterized protein YcfJ